MRTRVSRTMSLIAVLTLTLPTHVANADFEEECVEDTDRTFDQLLNAFKNQPPGDAVVARLRLGPAGARRAQSSVRVDAVVGGRLAIGFLLRR